MRNINLYLDDLRPTPEGFERVYDYEEFTEYISQNGMPDFISFDHDLGLGKQILIAPNGWSNIVSTIKPHFLNL